MFHIHLIRNLKTTIWLLVAVAVPVMIGVLYWANRTGLPDSWRNAIEQEISKHGAHVEIGSLTYVPLKGFVAGNVIAYAEKERRHEISRFERVRIVLDNTRLASGDFRLKKIELNNARLSVPVDPAEPDGEALLFTGIYGSIHTTGGRLIEIRNARGIVGGMEVYLNARLLGKKQDGTGDPVDPDQGRRREFVANIISELEHWTFDSVDPPVLRLRAEGDMTERSTMSAFFRIDAPSVEKNLYRIENFLAEGSLVGSLLTIDFFEGSDPRGEISGHADYHLSHRDGRFDVSSSIEIPRLLRSWFPIDFRNDFIVAGSQRIEASGSYDLSDFGNPKISVTGHARGESVMLRGTSFDVMESWFSYQNGNILLRDLVVERPDGMATGKALIDSGLVQLQLSSTLPVAVYRPLFSGQPLEKVLNDITADKAASLDIEIEGSFELRDPLSWAYTGSGSIHNHSYRGVPVFSAACSFSVNHHELDFHSGNIVFNYSAYPLRRAFAGPDRGSAKFGRIRYDNHEKMVEVEAVSGEIWAAPMVRLFAPQIADGLEQYRFHRPPLLRGSGKVDVTPQNRTRLDVNFSTPGNANYEFLGEEITLSGPKGKVLILGEEVRIADLSLDAFDGPVSGSFINRNQRLGGELNWTKLSTPALTSAYGFEMKDGGRVTGRIEFTIDRDDVSTMTAEGLLALENAELFAVPMFGPLTPLVAGVLGDKRAGTERAKAAFCNFTIKNGILSTQDFQTTTTSLNFLGDGEIDLVEQTIGFTMRLNARGFLGLITLPLRPFSGLFQFRGTGPIKKPVWENVRFTPPPEEQKTLFEAPKATIIRE